MRIKGPLSNNKKFYRCFEIIKDWNCKQCHEHLNNNLNNNNYNYSENNVENIINNKPRDNNLLNYKILKQKIFQI